MSEIDLEALHTVLDTHRATLGISWRDVATQTGLSPSTFSRLRSGISLDGYVSCCRWLDVPMDTFTTPSSTRPRSALNTDLVVLLYRHQIPEVYWIALCAHVSQLAATRPDALAAQSQPVE